MNTNLATAIQQLIITIGLTAFSVSTLAAVGQQNPPPGPGQIPDYFGVVPNFANSPQPILTQVTITDPSGAGSGAVAAATTYDYVNDVQTDRIMDVQLLSGGSGYDAKTSVTVSGGPGVSSITLTPLIVGGVITGFAEIPSASNPTIINNFTGLGSGFKIPLAGSGIRKFVDSLPRLNAPNNLGQQMPVGVADTTTFPGSDYYEIAEVEYIQKLHSDLPPTRLRGYVQIKNGGFSLADFNAAGDKLAYASQYAGYLGPVIVAQKDRPVRVKLVNLLPTGSAGNLPIPVDHTYMGTDGETDTDNRAALHLHGGNTPWISDGTPRQWTKPKGEIGPNKGESARNVPDMWFDASGNVVPTADLPTDPSAAGLSNDPGDGALTFFYTNEQSARLMFYHDHAEGITRLNVYAGVAAGYVLQDSTEQNLVANGTLPSLADTIPLIIQEKTFIPDDTTPVLNFYGPFKSALNSQDPTWRWGTRTSASGVMGNGDLWVPHVFMPNQNPGDVSGANSVGRWDYGAWFWPPFANLQNGPLPNPYFDPNCNTTTQYCEGPEIPGVPNGSLMSVLSNGLPGGVPDATKGGAITESPSGTPEAFNDTPLVNGTVYPFINVEPKKYRLRILSVGNDRMLNLSLVVAASKNTNTTAAANAGPTETAPAKLCDGTTSVDPADCTEVKMVPFDATQNKARNTPFPSHWYTKQKDGVTFDGRPSGVFDPTTRGPEMVQIGTEGGFLAAPVEIKNQPVNYEYNPKNILIGNIKEHALLLGPAERADVLVDFSNFKGSTLILYNDAPAPVPAWDLRLDYYTGNSDNTDTGGSFSVIPGYGPNSRTLMQIRVSNNGGTNTHPVDDLGNIDLAGLTTAVQTAFKSSQEPIIVPQSVYNNVYGVNAVDKSGADLSRISDHSLTYTPLDPSTLKLSTRGAVTLELEPKTIIEDWTMNWGRMNALLGTEVPHTTAINQTSIPQAFIDPPTDLVKITPNNNMVPISGTLPDGTQLWKITHNGVDSHTIHFHLFHVQLVNRVGWDGAIYPPELNELGWKDTVRMNPLSDTIVALRPMVMTGLPFKVPNSHRLLAPSLAEGARTREFFNFNPLNGDTGNVTNQYVNFGWEYLWHCHILGHEENDMMRTIAVAQPPEAPSNIKASGISEVKLSWTDNSLISNWVTIQRSTDPSFAINDSKISTLAFNVLEPECTSQRGCPRTFIDSDPPKNKSLYYRIKANNTVGAGSGRLDAQRNSDGSYGAVLPSDVEALTPDFEGFANVTANSNWSETASRLIFPTAKLSVTSLTFPKTSIGSSSPALTITLSNVGTGPLTISDIAIDSSQYRRSGGSCATEFPGNLNPDESCTIKVVFMPSSIGINNALLTITNNSSTGATQTVLLNGIGEKGPEAPSEVSIQRISRTSAAVRWVDNSDNEVSFQIQASTDGGANWTKEKTFTSSSSLKIGKGNRIGNVVVSNTTNAVYRVMAVQTPTLSTASAAPYANLDNTIAPPLAPVLTDPPGMAINPNNSTSRIVRLSWTDPSNNNSSYTVQRCNSTCSNNAWANVTNVLAGNVTRYANSSHTANTTYSYRIQAVNSAGSATSNIVTLTTP